MEATDQQAQAQIAEASIAVGKSLQQLAAIQMTVHPPKHLRRPFNPNTIGMSKTASISWVGPVEPVLKKIAQATHYHLRVVGHKPSLPVIVSLNAQNRPIADILRNIMYQVILKADIAVYAKSRTIELRYHGN
jgi:defect-in-organelle-trafficking protein DotD